MPVGVCPRFNFSPLNRVQPSQPQLSLTFPHVSLTFPSVPASTHREPNPTYEDWSESIVFLIYHIKLSRYIPWLMTSSNHNASINHVYVYIYTYSPRNGDLTLFDHKYVGFPRISIIFLGFFVAPFLSSVTAWHQRPSLGSPGVQLDPQALGAPFLQDLLPLLDLGLASSAASAVEGTRTSWWTNGRNIRGIEPAKISGDITWYHHQHVILKKM